MDALLSMKHLEPDHPGSFRFYYVGERALIAGTVEGGERGRDSSCPPVKHGKSREETMLRLRAID